MTKPNAFVILSGGQDSTTCLFEALRSDRYANVGAISFDYGQRHCIELEAAATIARIAGVQHYIIKIPKELLLSTSPLTDPMQSLETYDSPEEMDRIIGDRVEKTFVPMRNLQFLVIAANHAVASDVNILITGVCQEDNANYPDCRASFIDAAELAINTSLGRSLRDSSSIKIETPLMFLTKSESIRMMYGFGYAAFAALGFTHTSYAGDYPPLNANHSNVLRAASFAEAQLPDPLVIRAWQEGLMSLPASYEYDTRSSDFINTSNAISEIRKDLLTPDPDGL